MKRAMKGDFDLFGKAENLWTKLDTITDGKTEGESYFDEKARYISNFKKVILICINGVVKYFGKNLINEQEVMNNIADMMMETYISESLLLRVQKLETMKGTVQVYRDILDTNVYDASEVIRKSGFDAIFSSAEPESASSIIRALDALTKVRGINVKNARRRIADKLIEDNLYRF